MLIFDDNMDGYLLHNEIRYPNLIWEHDKERFICIRPNSRPEQNQLPIEIVIVPYDQIQYIRIYQDAKTFMQQNQATFAAEMDEKQVAIMNDMISRTITSKVIQ